jgi:hypothetical protein
MRRYGRRLRRSGRGTAIVLRWALGLALSCAVLAALPAVSMAAKGPKPRFSVVTKSQAGALEKGRLRVQVKLSKPGTVRLGARLADEADLPGTGKRSRLVKGKDVKFSKRKHKRTVSLKLTSGGRKIVERARDACAFTRVKVYGIAHPARPRGRLGPTKGRFASRSRRLQRDARTCAAGAGGGATYRVGVSSRSINPDPDGRWKGAKVFLGGFGLGGESAVQQGRFATGVLGNGLHVRAFAVSDGTHPAAIADIEAQGWFAATKDNKLGIVDMRRAVEQKTGGKLKASEVMIQSDHTHSGPDMMGVWGGAPLGYRQFVFNQTVDAVVDAYDHMRPGTLRYGTADGRDLLNNQFDYDAQNKVMDSDVRVLQARDGSGKPFATMLDFSAHATVLGSGNTKASGDWVQAENEILADRFGGDPMTVVGTLGRTQPNRGDCPNLPDNSPDRNLCKIGEYGGRVADRVERALANADPITGDPIVAARSYLIQDPATNVLLLGLEYGGDAAGAPLNRAGTPPWFTANVLGTVTGSVRIGDVLLSAVPGEIYPQIALKVRQLVPGIRGWMTAGLANDQLGYIIAPYTSYPEPIRRSFLGGQGDDLPDSVTPDPIGNDNYFFNVSHTLGERVTCSALRGAGQVFGQGSAYRDSDDQCPPFANDLLLDNGADAAQGSP